jgi:tRNA threonylcarbamoyladenosine biosynthesis protein TsaB
MLILALDTTQEEGGVGIFRDAECLALAPNNGKANHYSIALFELLEQALATAHVQLSDIELYAAANGPGSFTGIRVGLAASMAWGRVFNRPVRGVSVLEAMVTKARPTSTWAFPIMDAGRGEFYLASFQLERSDPAADCNRLHKSTDDGWLLKPDSLRALLEKRLATGADITCLARACDQSAIELCASLPQSPRCMKTEGVLVDSLAAIALRAAQTDPGGTTAKLDAYYLRRPDAEMNWKE